MTQLNESNAPPPEFLQNVIITLFAHGMLCALLTIVGIWITDGLEEMQRQLMLWQVWLLPLGVLLGIFTWCWSFLIFRIFKRIVAVEPERESAQFEMIRQMIQSRWFVLLAVPALGEELLFRGFLQPLLISIFEHNRLAHPAFFGILLPALVYAKLHPDPSGKHWTAQQLVRMLALGSSSALWGCAAYWTGSLWTAILAHGTQNFMHGYTDHILYSRNQRTE